jgi:hypothetical protein
MTLQISHGAMALGISPHDPVLNALADKMLGVLRPLMDARNPRRLRRMVKDASYEFVPIKEFIVPYMGNYAEARGLNTQELIRDIVGAFYEAAHGEVNLERYLSYADRRLFLKILGIQAEIGDLRQNTPQENRPALVSALIEAYWALQRVDVCFTAILAVCIGDLHPSETRIPHWLCLIADDAIEEFRSALFGNNPVLRERLSRSLHELKTTSLEDLERELGLQR